MCGLRRTYKFLRSPRNSQDSPRFGSEVSRLNLQRVRSEDISQIIRNIVRKRESYQF